MAESDLLRPRPPTQPESKRPQLAAGPNQTARKHTGGKETAGGDEISRRHPKEETVKRQQEEERPPEEYLDLEVV